MKRSRSPSCLPVGLPAAAAIPAAGGEEALWLLAALGLAALGWLALRGLRRRVLRLRQSEAHLARAQVLARIGSYEWDIVADEAWFSAELYRICGLERKERRPRLKDFVERVHPEDREAFERELAEALAGSATAQTIEVRLRLPDGTVRHLRCAAQIERDAAGRAIWKRGTMQDVSEREAHEDQLVQARKLEAMGRVAGGVAHDFNNLLTVILGGVDLALDELPEGSAAAERLAPARQAAERAADLTGQLLAFARRQVVEPVVVDPGLLVRESEQLLRRLLAPAIELSLALPADLWPIRVDRGQFQQILLNLAVNARDAMPGGGKLSIRAENVAGPPSPVLSGPAALLPAPQGSPGAGRAEGAGDEWVMLAVTDNGVGIDPKVQEHVFEPFFTTKEQGTGLGLATAHGIVAQSGGYIRLASAPGAGATFSIFFPRALAARRIETEEPGRPRHAGARGVEMVLLVDDEEAVRASASAVLRQAGYVVLEAGSADQALTLARGHSGPIHLLLSDIVMPLVSGVELARRLRALRPEAEVLLVSGYAQEGAAAEVEGFAFLQKPYTPLLLAAKVREVLDQPRVPARSLSDAEPAERRGAL